jgi:hypothetical protein
MGYAVAELEQRHLMLPGFASSYGIFQEYYSTHDFAGSANIAVVGACAMVTICLGLYFTT